MRVAGLLLCCTFAFAQGDRVGLIELFGFRGMDVEAVRKALPVREGSIAPEDDADRESFLKGIEAAVIATIGRPPTDISPVCCDQNGAWILYIGLGGITVSTRPRPSGSALLPTEFVTHYDTLIEANEQAVRSGATEDHSRGFALSTLPELRARQLQFHEHASKLAPVLYSVLRNSKDDKHRSIAAHAIGYLSVSSRQVDALVEATHDVSSTVRNNAVRALWVIADSGESNARQIPVSAFVPLLGSDKWSDRNKALLLLASRIKNDRKAATDLRPAIQDLKEMAQWRNPGHSESARVLLECLSSLK